MATSDTQDTKSDSTKEDSIIISYPDYLGGGSFGFVYKGTYGGQEVAVKTINKHMLIGKGKYENIDKNEIIPLFKGLHHPNIVSILALEDHDYELWLAMELCTASLDKYLKDNDPGYALTLDILRQGAAGLAYLHENGIIHRDLRPDNELILMKDTGPIVKITDFSLCKDVADQPTSSMTTVWGNRYWVAPELLTVHGDKTEDIIRYKRMLDVFSCGLVILYVCVNDEGRTMINRRCCGGMIKRGEDVLGTFVKYWRSRELKVTMLPLLKRMLALNPEARPTVAEVFLQIDPTTSPAPVVPPEVPIAPRLHPLASHRLEYKAHSYVGISGDSHILLGREDPETLELLQLRAGAFHQEWEKPCPPVVGWRDRKYVLGDIITTRHFNNHHPTRCWDLDLQRLHEHEEDEGLGLVSCLAPHVRVYREKIGKNGYQLVLRGCEMARLCPPAGSPWDRYLSVCQHDSTGWYAMSESVTHALDIFDEAGTHQHHVSLTYEPGSWDAICCTETHLIVRESSTAVLHIHTWSGQEVGTVDLRQVCGLSGVYVKRVAVCDGGRTLIVAVCDLLMRVCSLHALTISD